jgi:IS605 OrfB family transposase
MPQVYQTYVTQIDNGYSGELPAISLLSDFSPVAESMSLMALAGLKDNLNKSKVNTQIQQAFGVNKRYANSVINFVNGELLSAQSSYFRHIEILDAKIKSINETISNLNKRFQKHRHYVQAIEKQNKSIKFPQNARNNQVSKLVSFKKKPEFDDACPINGRQHGKTYLQLALFQLHQKKRQLKMYLDRKAAVIKRGVKVNLGNLGKIPFIGSTGETGSNQICQFEPGIIPVLKIRVPYFLESSFGEYIQLPLYKFNKHGGGQINTSWALNRALSYVFSRNKKGKWVVAIMTAVDFSDKSNNRELGCIGLDINPGSIGWCATNEHGNPIAWGKVNLDLHSCSSGQTDARLSDSITEITTRALASNKPIVIEKLDFSQKKKQFKNARKYNRMLSGFAYSKFFELLRARCLKLGIRVIEVSPKYSSQIGVVKYMGRYGMGSDSAAALVIARRGMGIYYEKLPARYALQSEIQASPRKHVFAHWQRFNKHYKKIDSRNAWFGVPNLTGSIGDSLVDTGYQEITKAQVRGGEFKPRLVVKV